MKAVRVSESPQSCLWRIPAAVAIAMVVSTQGSLAQRVEPGVPRVPPVDTRISPRPGSTTTLQPSSGNLNLRGTLGPLAPTPTVNGSGSGTSGGDRSQAHDDEPGGGGPPSMTPIENISVSVCIATTDYSEQCTEGGWENASVAVAHYLISMYFEREFQGVLIRSVSLIFDEEQVKRQLEFSRDLSRIEAHAIDLTENWIRHQMRAIQPFPQDTPELAAQKREAVARDEEQLRRVRATAAATAPTGSSWHDSGSGRVSFGSSAYGQLGSVSISGWTGQ